MKTKIHTNILAILMFLGMPFLPQKTTAQVAVNFQLFYDDLNPYGYWSNSPDYGYVWIPKASAGFAPYNTNGHWVYTNAGWTWVSDYSWGWAPFHYGRWYQDPYYGWAWVPGTVWGPAWVTWRSSDDYYGWAPIGPATSVNLAYSNAYTIPYNQWTFVKSADFGRPNISNYYINDATNATIIKNTTTIPNIHKNKAAKMNYHAGPPRKEVEAKTGKKITQLTVNNRNAAGQKMTKDELQLYRPKLNKNGLGKKPAPAKVTDPQRIKSQKQQERKANKSKQQLLQDQLNSLKDKKKELQKQREQHILKEKQQKVQELREQNIKSGKLQQAQEQREQKKQRTKQQQK